MVIGIHFKTLFIWLISVGTNIAFSPRNSVLHVCILYCITVEYLYILHIQIKCRSDGLVLTQVIQLWMCWNYSYTARTKVFLLCSSFFSETQNIYNFYVVRFYYVDFLPCYAQTLKPFLKKRI